MCTHDAEGRILSVNRAFCDALGLPEAAILAKRITDFLSADAAPEFAAYVQTVMRNSVAAGTMKVVTSDGATRIMEYRSNLDTDGAAHRLIVRAMGRDVTEREEASRSARNSEKHFRSIIENASDVIAIVELDGRIRYESPSVERVLGYPPDLLPGTSFLDLIHPDDAGSAAEFLSSQIADPASTQRVELRVRHHRGAWRSFEIVANTVVTRGEVSAIVVNARDITERKLLEAQLLQAHRLAGLGRLAATVAHEFNNVLMGMQPFAELMQRPNATREMTTKGAAHIANSIQRGKRIVLDILRFTQPYVPVTASVDLRTWWNTFAPEAVAVLGNMISVVSKIPADLSIVADVTQLSQVLSNLVANAREAMPFGGRFIVEATGLAAGERFPFGVVPDSERFVQVSVRDTGHGMSAEVMDRAFEPLYTTRESGGTGLGLAVARQVVTQHGGHIFVESEAGCGTTFYLFFPKATSASLTESVAALPGCVPCARRLLIIDDEEQIVGGISAVLEQDGIEVEGIGSGFEAIEAILRFHPDVILLDYGLPGMNGSEVYAMIRESHPSIPIIFATGHGNSRVLLGGFDHPRTRFLQKPFELAELLATIVDLEIGVTQ